MLKIKNFLEYVKCSNCGNEFLTYYVEKINKNDYLCYNCQHAYDYSTKNNQIKGKRTQTSYSFEFETSSRSKRLYELLKYNFIGCYDSSIGGLEWKSPIFFNRKSFHFICKKIEKFANLVGPDCGTHLHVSTQYKNKIHEFQKELFSPILEIMKSEEDKTEKFWGRFFNSYCCSTISDYSRYNSFNTLSSVQTLEFRLLRFKTSEQYIRACDFCIDITQYINHFICKSEFNKEQAEKIGKIIAERYKEVIKDV